MTDGWQTGIVNIDDFNSHARVGRDAERWIQRQKRRKISTHTPAWGVTSTDTASESTRRISTHTPAWGVTIQAFRKNARPIISTHTPAWGVT